MDSVNVQIVENITSQSVSVVVTARGCRLTLKKTEWESLNTFEVLLQQRSLHLTYFGDV